jgi:hypothetical protein
LRVRLEETLLNLFGEVVLRGTASDPSGLFDEVEDIMKGERWRKGYMEKR